ncbi:isoprenylcysteine carboxylmethyltransferase family protein [Ferrimonas pelagia]|uniref:Isoprenylcysteine carboxylmethyltransferase family protein n=1 Tax=Ferrimonas pelagia TaxID=1177826 RepID=A0ABP9FCW5_9GAMM
MHALELKVPPLLIALIASQLMTLLARLGPRWPLPPVFKNSLLALALALGVLIALAGVLAFRRASTTVHPARPDATALVNGGIYRLTRNPMYLGMLLALLGWSLYLSALLPLLVLPLFVLYMNRFQIGPEERHLLQRFGREFDHYCQRVRRWL